jgi:hypothetical protein
MGARTMDDGTISQLARVRTALTTLGIDYSDLGTGPLGAGISVAGTEADRLVLSVARATNRVLGITLGLLKDVRHDRFRLLELCNAMTRDNAALPVFLHDGPGGWDIHLQQRLEIELLLADPNFFRSCLQTVPAAAAAMRSRFRERGVESRPYGRAEADARRLLARSLI